MLCTHPEFTGVHDNNRFSELCPRSRAAKRIKDSRYIHGHGKFGVYIHRHYMAFLRRCLNKYGEDSRYEELFGSTNSAKATADWEQALADERARCRAGREAHRGPRRKIDNICTGRNGVISVKEV